MNAFGSRHVDLYSHKRNEEANAIKQTLLRTNVLRNGEYNYDTQTEKGLWETSTQFDYKGTRPRTADKVLGDPTAHLKSSLVLGKPDEGTLYKQSLTKEDFGKLYFSKPTVHGEDRTIKWPDMSPKYSPDRKMGSSIYKNTFLVSNLQPSSPVFSKNKKLLSGESTVKPSIVFGSDDPYFDSEAQNSFAPQQAVGRNDAYNISSKMKSLARKSSVFRSGDYNDMQQEPGSMFTLDFGKQSSTPSTIKMTPKSASQKTLLQDVTNKNFVQQIPQMLDRCMKEERFNVLKEAIEGRQDHESAHFLFGSDEKYKQSVYSNDFLKNSIPHPKMSTMKYQPAPPDSQIMHYDPAHRSFGQTTAQDLNVQGSFTSLNSGQKASKPEVRSRWDTSVKLSYDTEQHVDDRMHSLSHESYVRPPSSYKVLHPNTTPKPLYNYLVADGALTYPLSSQNKSESTNQYRLMDAVSSNERQMLNKELNKAQKQWGQSTHFTTGYHPPTFNTAHEELFSNWQSQMQGKKNTNKKENIAESEFKHFHISDNTQDLSPNPFRVDIMAPVTLQSQAISRSIPALPVHQASLMTNDFQAMENRKYTQAQLMVMQQNELMNKKPIEKTHFFHCDTSGAKNFQTTAMADYIKPELVPSTPRNMASVK